MDMTKEEGYGYEWDAFFNGGPADGLFDRVIKINDNTPPKFLKKIVDGNDIVRESLGEKLIEYLTNDQVDGNQKVAVYKLRRIVDEDEKCIYDFIKIVKMKDFREKCSMNQGITLY